MLLIQNIILKMWILLGDKGYISKDENYLINNKKINLIIVIKYYFETQNNILYVIGYKISNDFSLIWNFEDYTYKKNQKTNIETNE